MHTRDVIVVGASAGGIEALKEIAAGLPGGLPAAIFAALHVAPGGPGILPRILSRSGPLPAVHPRDGEPWRRGHVYVAPSDHHLLVRETTVRVVRGPKENGHRPSIDPLFRSAAVFHGPRVVGVVLTGALDDGTAGLKAVRTMGGLAIVQDPLDATNPSMPQSALRAVGADHVAPLTAIAPLLARLAGEPVPDAASRPVPEALAREVAIAEMVLPKEADMQRRGRRSLYSCPECQGGLWEVKEGELMRFRCHVGHAYTSETLLAEKTGSLEATLWASLRMLEENADLTRRLAARARHRGHQGAAVRFEERANIADGHAERLRQILSSERAPEAGPAEAGVGASAGEAKDLQ
jgi:two-component system chemotaxis response regulator CheB